MWEPDGSDTPLQFALQDCFGILEPRERNVRTTASAQQLLNCLIPVA